MDYDGTLTDAEQRLCGFSLRAIEAILRLGGRPILVSARPYYVLEALSLALGLGRTLISENGATVAVEGELHILGDKGKALAALEALKADLGVEGVGNNVCRLGDVAVRRPKGRAGEELFLKIKRYLSGRGFGVRVYDTGYAIHIVDERVNKGAALKYVAEKIGAERIYAIGDSDADLDMLRVADVGIAVANASERLKREADYVASRPHGEGVMEAVEVVILGDRKRYISSK